MGEKQKYWLLNHAYTRAYSIGVLHIQNTLHDTIICKVLVVQLLLHGIFSLSGRFQCASMLVYTQSASFQATSPHHQSHPLPLELYKEPIIFKQ